MGRFGLGTDYGIALARRPPSGTWQPASALSHGTCSVGSRVGAADDGELVTAWVETGAGGGLQATGLAP
jgi:hypothetical protein